MIELLLFRKKEILIGAATVIVLAVAFITYAASGPTPAAYMAAELAYSEWLAEPKDMARYEAMEQAFRKAPALKKKYESAIAQRLFVVGRTEEAVKIAQGVLARSKAQAPLHAAFAAGSLLIEQGAYQQALEQSVALKEQMQDHKPFILYGELLIRIAHLHQQMKNQPGEKVAWEELQAHLKTDPAAADSILGSFSEKQVDLMHYMTERQKALG